MASTNGPKHGGRVLAIGYSHRSPNEGCNTDAILVSVLVKKLPRAVQSPNFPSCRNRNEGFGEQKSLVLAIEQGQARWQMHRGNCADKLAL